MSSDDPWRPPEGGDETGEVAPPDPGSPFGPPPGSGPPYGPPSANVLPHNPVPYPEHPYAHPPGSPPDRRPGLTLGIMLSGGAQAVVAAVVTGLALSGSGVDFTLAMYASLAVVVTGIVLAVARRQDRIGEGIVIGWAIGLVLVPLVVFGMCVQAMQDNPL